MYLSQRINDSILDMIVVVTVDILVISIKTVRYVVQFTSLVW